MEKQKRIQEKLKIKRKTLRDRISKSTSHNSGGFSWVSTILILVVVGLCWWNISLHRRLEVCKDYDTSNYTEIQHTILNDDDAGYVAELKNFSVISYNEHMGNYTTVWGTPLTPNKSCAVDPRVIPYGAYVIIDGEMYVAEDTGEFVEGERIIGICTTEFRPSKITDVLVIVD